jgi:putative membrane protein
MDFLSEHYLAIKSLHIIAVISWMAGMLYLPRLFVYHSELDVTKEETNYANQMLKVMERRLLRYIINPAMVASLVFGVMLIVITGAMQSGGWMHIKLVLLLGMFAVHGMLARYRKDFEKDSNKHSPKFYRILNEVPTLLIIGIVFLAVMKPF